MNSKRLYLAIGAGVLVLVGAALAGPMFPIKDAKTAIAIGKAVCSGKADPHLKWSADLDVSGRIWDVSTAPSIAKKMTTHLWIVELLVNGPYPKDCADSLYNFIPAKQTRWS